MTKQILHSVLSTAQMLSIGRSSLYLLIADGEIPTVKIGRRTLIREDEILKYVERLEEGYPVSNEGSENEARHTKMSLCPRPVSSKMEGRDDE